MRDPIVNEVRKIREEIFREHGNNLALLVKHLRKRERMQGRKTVKLQPKRIRVA